MKQEGRLGISVVLLLLLLCTCMLFINAEKVSYEGYKILSIQPKTEQEVLLIKSLPSLDVHRGIVAKNVDADVMISSEDYLLIHESLPSLSFTIKEENVQLLIDNHKRELEAAEKLDRASRAETETFFDNYRTLDEIDTYINYLLQQYPGLTRSEHIGESIEKRNISVVVITNKTSTVSPKRLVLFNAGQHAREWLAPSTVLYSMTQLLLQQDDATVNSLLNSIEFHFIPMINPDGYVYTQTNRMWRKNRRHHTGNIYGVDTNRNWGKNFGVGSASNDKSEETYEGSHPFSEPETHNVAVYIKGKDFRCHVDFHTYGQFILRRWASSTDVSPDDAVMKEAGDAARDAVIAAGGSTYQSDNGRVLGIDGGCMPDWTYAERGMISYTIELSNGGFVLPPSSIVPIGKEGYAMIKTLARFVADGKADKDKMKWTDPNAVTTTPPPPHTSGDGHGHTDTDTHSSEPFFSTADLLLIFVVLFVGIVTITVVIVGIKQWYTSVDPRSTYLATFQEEEGEGEAEEMGEVANK